MTPDVLAQASAATIHDRFEDYRDRFQQITRRAPERFINRQWPQLQADTATRLSLYPAAVDRTEAAIRKLLGERVDRQEIWIAARTAYALRIAACDDRELAETFFNSVTRRIFDTVGVNRRIEFVRDDHEPAPSPATAAVFDSYPLSGDLTTTVRRLFTAYTTLPFDSAALDRRIPQIVERLRQCLGKEAGPDAVGSIDMLRPVFYRGQGAYLIGRIATKERRLPMVAALLHSPTGIVIDALLLDADGVSIVFSYTRSAFHVPLERPGEIVDFLRSILPAKPEAELYSAIGCFKHGKTVLYRDMCRHTAECTDDRFHLSPGKRGMVMAVFEMTGHDMVVKLIRDRFDNPKKTTRARVMAQYDFVFKHYRVGRLIEAHAFEHLSFDRCWFTDDLLEHLTAEAGQTVHLQAERVIIDHAYLERRVTPLDLYLKMEGPENSGAAVIDFGNAIKDLAVANIFPGDMLLKNFGVTRRRRVVFYDYDEIVPMTDCRFRKIPQARTDLEELSAEPWYTVEENDVFPEEFARFLGLSPPHRELFLHHHADLLTTDFWLTVQEEIRQGKIRHVHPYHSRYRFVDA